MDVQHRLRKGAIEIIPKGKLDINHSEDFESKFNEKALAAQDKIIGINLGKIEYIDSSGLGVLIKSLNAAKNEGKSLLMFGASAKIQNIFQLARLEKFFTFTSGVEFDSKYPSSEDDEMESYLNNL